MTSSVFQQICKVNPLIVFRMTDANTGWPKKNETHEHVNKNFSFQAIATKHHTFHLNLMHGLHTKFH